MTPLARYTLYQIPGIVVAAAFVAVACLWTSLPIWAGLAAVGGWIVKDIVLYPLLKSAYESPDAADPAGLIGRRAFVTDRPLAPAGRVRIGAELWRATLAVEGAEAEPGRRVRVHAVDGLTLIVVLDDTPSDE